MSTHGRFYQRAGGGMILAAWLVMLGLLFMFFRQVLEKQSNPNQDLLSSVDTQGIAEVRLRRNRAGHYVAMGEINGKPVVFFVDTGASEVAVPGAVARDLGLKQGRRVLRQTANGTAEGHSTRLASVRLGDIRLRDVRATIMPGMGGTQVLLGMSFLRNVEMVQRRGVLTLRYPAP